MATTSDKIEITGTDLLNGAILIHFSDGISVLYHPKFLYDVQNDDGNVPISNEPNKEPEE